jgi:hypothetical protein
MRTPSGSSCRRPPGRRRSRVARRREASVPAAKSTLGRSFAARSLLEMTTCDWSPVDLHRSSFWHLTGRGRRARRPGVFCRAPGAASASMARAGHPGSRVRRAAPRRGRASRRERVRGRFGSSCFPPSSRGRPPVLRRCTAANCRAPWSGPVREPCGAGVSCARGRTPRSTAWRAPRGPKPSGTQNAQPT